MAAHILETLKQEITCPLCLDVFKRPKKLPCDHVYCQECLSRLFASQRRAGNTLSCPECRIVVQVSSPDCSNFSTSFHINRLIEVYAKGLRETEDSPDGGGARVSEFVSRGGEGAMAGPGPANCGIHRSEALSLYCETCEKLVCRDCVMFSCAKSDHSYGYVQDMLEKHQSALSDSLFTVKELQQRLRGTLDVTRDFERKINEEEEKVVARVDATFEELFAVLKEERSSMLTKLKGRFQVARTDSSARGIQVAAVCEKLEQVLSSEKPSDNGSRFFVKLRARKAIIRQVVKTALDLEHSDSMKIPGVDFSVLKPDKLRELCKNSMSVSDICDALQCHFKSDIEWNDMPQLATSLCPLYLDTPTNSLPELKGHLYCKHTKNSYPVEVLEQGTKSYTVLLHPMERGRFELNIMHKGRHISVSPVQLYVTVQPIRLQGIRYTMLSFKRPMGVKCVGEQVLLSELGKGLAVLRPHTLERLSTISMSDIWEVYFDTKSKHLYCTSNTHHALKKMTEKGSVLKCIGGKGTALGKFCWPNGIRCSKKGEILVCDTMNNRIQAFDKDLNFLHVINIPALRTPDDLDFDEKGNLYVANQGANNIAVLTPDGSLLRTIGDGILSNPISVAINRKWVYVTDTGSGCISVFTTTGEFVTTFGKGTLKKPECVAIDRDGYIYITDNRSSVFVF